jgi:hypothetical protein
MVANQIERLRRDSRDLGHYIHKLNKKGKSDAAFRMQKKQAFLDAAIQQVSNRG